MRNSVKITLFVFILLSISNMSNMPVHYGLSQQPGNKATVSLLQPRRDGQLDCSPDAGAIFRCLVNGTVTGLSGSQTLLLWVRPVRPRSESDGWYLQRRSNGVVHQSANSWDGQIQIGNRDFPPEDGNVVDIAISIVEGAVADKLMKAPGVVIELEPVGLATARSENVRLRISRKH